MQRRSITPLLLLSCTRNVLAAGMILITVIPVKQIMKLHNAGTQPTGQGVSEEHGAITGRLERLVTRFLNLEYGDFIVTTKKRKKIANDKVRKEFMRMLCRWF